MKKVRLVLRVGFACTLKYKLRVMHYSRGLSVFQVGLAV